MTVQRYDLDNTGNGWEPYGNMVESTNGDWVTSEEYDRLTVKVLELKEEVQDLKNELRYIEGR